MAKERFINRKKSFSIEVGNALQESLDFIEDALRDTGLENKLAMRTLLVAEEMIPQLILHAAEGGQLRVQVRRYFGDISVMIRAAGERFDPFENPADTQDGLGEMEDEEAQQAIRAILLKSQGDKLKVSHKNGVNHVRILADRPSQQMILQMAGAIVLGVICGLLMRFVLPDALAEGIGTYVLEPIRTMFMNALEIVIGPVVFFSIVSCIAQFKDLSELGRVGAKVMGMYFMTTVLAVLLALGISLLLHPGTPGFALTQGDAIAAVSVDTDVDTSFLHAIINIIPSNFARPFLEANTLQIIFLALLCGIAVGMIGEYTPVLQEFFEACNSLSLTVTTLISRLIPLVVFCSVAMMTVEMSGASVLSVFGFAGAALIGYFCMLVIYGLLVLLMGRLNPITFFRKNKEAMLANLTLFSPLGSSMLINMQTCTDKLGVSPRVCAFSIPLGATVNMDGTCIFLTVSGLFLARAYGVAVSTPAMMSLAITIILLSLGSPSVPGAALVCLGVVLANLGVPIEAIGLIMAINPFLDMFGAVSNTTGDVAVSLIVAKSEGLLDREVFRK